MTRAQDLAALVRAVLERSSGPLYVRRIARTVLEMKPDVVPRPIYNPAKSYSASQRVYHASPKCEGWFRIESVGVGSFVARFDDGRRMKLSYGGTRQQLTFPVTREEYLATKIEALLHSLPGLHERGGLWDVRPVVASKPLVTGRQVAGPKPPAAEQMGWTDTPPLSTVGVDAVCRRHNIDCFYHLTRLENLSGILADGLLCRNRVKHYHDISNAEIQHHRHFKSLSQNPEVTLHDCACLFVAPMPPMLSALREQQAEIVYLHIDPKVLALPGVEFTDGNARSHHTRFYYQLDDLRRLDWQILRARYWSADDPEERSENKRLRSAEILVPACVAATYIQQISVMTRDAYDRALGIIRSENAPIPIRIDPRMYYPAQRPAPRSGPTGERYLLEPPPALEDELPF